MKTILERFEQMNVWRRGGERAPHKPLLILLALGRLARGREDLPFRECDELLTPLLREFGPSRDSYHPEYPFWRLRNDGLWDVVSDAPLRSRESNDDPPKSELREKHAVGSFPPEVRRALLEDARLRDEVIQRVLAAHFPESIHQDILTAVGLSMDYETVRRRPRDPDFRKKILIAYENRCALCGLDLRISSITIAVEAAHVRWHQADGPDTETNGIALCSLHHKVFDLGAFTIDPDRRVLVSEQVSGAGQFEEVLLRHHGRLVAAPMRLDQSLLREHLDWHRREVFKERPRPLE